MSDAIPQKTANKIIDRIERKYRELSQRISELENKLNLKDERDARIERELSEMKESLLPLQGKVAKMENEISLINRRIDLFISQRAMSIGDHHAASAPSG